MIKCSREIVCSICGLCPNHCMEHVVIRKALEPYQIPENCKALLRIVKDSLVMVGRSDTRLIPEEARELGRFARRKRAA